MRFSAMTYNIRHCRGNIGERAIDTARIADALVAENADIVGLQEVYRRGFERASFRQAKRIAAAAGYPYVRYVHAATRLGYSHGNALLTRFPIVWSRVVELDGGARRREGKLVERRVALQALLNVPDGEGGARQVMVLVTHLGHDEQGQTASIARLVELVGQSDHPTIVLGDFNLRPESARLAPLLANVVDVAVAADAPHPTYPSRKPKVRIDYILSSGAIDAHGCRVVDALASDHRPVRAEFSLT